MTFLQIMREVYRARRAGVSSAVAIMTACGDDDACWDTLFERLVQVARLDSRLTKMRRRA